MISLLQAKTLALAACPLGPLARLPLLDAQDLYLAEPVVATRSSPGCDNSAMDGVAVQAADVRLARREQPVFLKVQGTVFAGNPVPSEDLRPGSAYRVYTGAPIPFGADAVVRLEALRDEGQTVAILVPPTEGEHIRRRGEEYQDGQLVLPPGTRLDAAALGVLASLGLATAPVRPRPRVGILTLGDELIAPGRPALPHQVFDANGTLIAALAREAGGHVLELAHAGDDDVAVREELRRMLSKVDLVITCGGASVGAKDRAKAALRALGATLGVDGVALKPGKPVGIAVLDNTAIAVLPGNPGAAAVAFDQLVRPMILKMLGVVEVRRRIPVRLDAPRHKQAGLAYFLSARLESRPEGSYARIRPQGAGQLLPNVGADGWVVLPPGKGDFAAEELVELELFTGATCQPLLATPAGTTPGATS